LAKIGEALLELNTISDSYITVLSKNDFGSYFVIRFHTT
jgi:hypothetical protein